MKTSTRFLSMLVITTLLFLSGLPASSQDSTFLLRKDDRIRGDQRAPVTLLEYSDYTCGYCEKFFEETWPLLYSDYIQTGKVRLIYRDFPRAISGPSVDTAMAARCAGEQGQYWSMHDRLFASHRKFSHDQLQKQAEDLRLNIQQFNECFQEERYMEAIYQDRMEGGSIGVRGTPHFILFLTHNPEAGPFLVIPGAFPYTTFEEQIENLLSKLSAPTNSNPL
ncbi:MAG: DsbA family protein [Pseudomonadales bacterium]|nr:DsbA family protein [Pseudomonadales bacterium]MEC9005836.1 thioredoxin domain-containing protein [Nitrospirota bacterium]